MFVFWTIFRFDGFIDLSLLFTNHLLWCFPFVCSYITENYQFYCVFDIWFH